MLGVYLILDYLWLGIIAQQDYQNALGALMRDEFPIWPWATFYVLYCACLLKLAIVNISNLTIKSSMLNGAIVGFASYGAYNLTTYTIIDGWPLGIVFKDLGWGIFISSVVCGSGAWMFLHSVPQDKNPTSESAK